MASVSMSDYLKKYISDDKTGKKKKKKSKTSNLNTKSRIVDDDVDFSSLLPKNLKNTLDEDVEEDNPVVVGIIDERPEHVKKLEEYRADKRWKLLHQDSNVNNNTGSENDQSPVRRKRHDSDSDQSLARRRHDSDSDQSPVRRKRHDSDSGQSPVRRKRHDSDSDQSPVRRKRHDSDSDQSPVRRKRHDSDSDQSPVRRKRHDSDSDESPARRKRHNSDSDQSPARRKNKQNNFDDNQSSVSRKRRQSPPRRKRHDSDSDTLSRMRKTKFDSDHKPSKTKDRSEDEKFYSKTIRNTDDNELLHKKRRYKSRFDQSPSRKNFDSDQSPQRRRGSDSDLSPPRKRTNESQDSRDILDSFSNLSRKIKTEPCDFVEEFSDREKKKIPVAETSTATDKMVKTLSGKRAGLSSAKHMRAEADLLRKKEDDAFQKIGDEALGRNAKTVFRDKSGKKRNLVEEREKEEEENAKKREKEQKYQKWGTGLKQQEMRNKHLEDTVHEMSKPLARYKNDDDLDKMMRDMDREGDPMLAFIKKKKKTDKQSGIEKPRYKGPAPAPNRFAIMPGYRWDGVDRSNGFEKKMFSKMSDRKALASQAYKWSTEDM